MLKSTPERSTSFRRRPSSSISVFCVEAAPKPRISTVAPVALLPYRLRVSTPASRPSNSGRVRAVLFSISAAVMMVVLPRALPLSGSRRVAVTRIFSDCPVSAMALAPVSAMAAASKAVKWVFMSFSIPQHHPVLKSGQLRKENDRENKQSACIALRNTVTNVQAGLRAREWVVVRVNHLPAQCAVAC